MSLRRALVLISLLLMVCAVLSPANVLLWAVFAPLLFLVAILVVRDPQAPVELVRVPFVAHSPLPSRAPPAR